MQTSKHPPCRQIRNLCGPSIDASQEQNGQCLRKFMQGLPSPNMRRGHLTTPIASASETLVSSLQMAEQSEIDGEPALAQHHMAPDSPRLCWRVSCQMHLLIAQASYTPSHVSDPCILLLHFRHLEILGPPSSCECILTLSLCEPRSENATSVAESPHSSADETRQGLHMAPRGCLREIPFVVSRDEAGTVPTSKMSRSSNSSSPSAAIVELYAVPGAASPKFNPCTRL